MKKNIIDWLLEKSQEEHKTPEEEVSWIKENYNFVITNEKKFTKFLETNNYLNLAMNYLEIFKIRNIGDTTSEEVIDFVDLDKNINFITLVSYWKIRFKIFETLRDMDLKSFDVQEKDKSFKRILKVLKELVGTQRDEFCKSFNIEPEYFEAFIIHVENIDFLKKEILDNNGTLFSMKDENITYNSLYEYSYFCIKYLLSDEESFEYKTHIKNTIEKASSNTIIESYKKMFSFVKWEA